MLSCVCAYRKRHSKVIYCVKSYHQRLNHENNRNVAASSTTYGALTDSSSSAAYYFKVTRLSFTFLKIKSANANIVAQLYMSTDSGYKQTNFYNLSSSSGFSDIVLPGQ